MRKNKVIALFIDTFGLGYLGLDRIYLGCYLSGVLKFACNVIGALFLFSTTSSIAVKTVGALMVLAGFVWTTIDSLTLLYNAIVESPTVPYLFCSTPMMWKDEQNIVDAKNVAIVLLLISVLMHMLAWQYGSVTIYEITTGAAK
jgi:TM2 domain-containing membrane protein YozV